MESLCNLPALADYMQARNGVGINLLAPPEENLSWMFQRYLMQKAISVFRWTIPETWDKDYLLYCFDYLIASTFCK